MIKPGSTILFTVCAMAGVVLVLTIGIGAVVLGLPLVVGGAASKG